MGLSLERLTNVADLAETQEEAEQLLAVLYRKVDALEQLQIALAGWASVLEPEALEVVAPPARVPRRRGSSPRGGAGDKGEPDAPALFPVGNDKQSPLVDRVLALLESEDKSWRSRDIAASLGVTREQVDGALKNLFHRKHKIVHEDGRRWRAAEWVAPGGAVA